MEKGKTQFSDKEWIDLAIVVTSINPEQAPSRVSNAVVHTRSDGGHKNKIVLAKYSKAI